MTLAYFLGKPKSMNRVKDKVILVTGGASGIGQATCFLLASHGAKVAVLDLDEKGGLETVSDISKKGQQARFWKMDATNEGEVQKTIHAVSQEFGQIHVLVNNIGMIGDNHPTHELSEAQWDRVMNVNVKSVFFCTKYVVPHLKKGGGGSIINISSIHGLIGTADYPANHASKGAVTLMTKTDAMLYAKDRIRVNSIHPGYIWTPLLEKVAAKEKMTPEQFRARFNSLQPVGFMGDPQDVAYGVLYLASDESRFMTASELVIDGGFTGGRSVS